MEGVGIERCGISERCRSSLKQVIEVKVDRILKCTKPEVQCSAFKNGDVRNDWHD
jgi:hypothetical protein